MTTADREPDGIAPGMTAERVAADWIAYSRYPNPNTAPDDLFDRAWMLYDLSSQLPVLAWETIKLVIADYTEDDLFTEADTEGRRVVGNLAAGPLEDLLARHGKDMIEAIETEARRDRRMAWAVGCVWQNAMTDDIWARVQKAAGGLSR